MKLDLSDAHHARRIGTYYNTVRALPAGEHGLVRALRSRIRIGEKGNGTGGNG